MKICTKCKRELPEEAFSMRLGKRRQKCRECSSAEYKAWYARNPEAQRKRAKEWGDDNPERKRQNFARWNEEHHAERLEYYRVYNEAHREEQRARDRIRHSKETPEMRRLWYIKRRPYFARWYQENIEHNRAREHRWRRLNPTKNAEKRARRQARKMNAPIVDIIDRDALIARDQSVCYLCGRTCSMYVGRAGRNDELTLDHVIPLIRGGTHTADNLRVACRECNSRKGTRLLSEM